MNLTFPQLLAGAVGALLIYAAIVNKTPVQALKDAMSGVGPPQRTVPLPASGGNPQFGAGGGLYGQ